MIGGTEYNIRNIANDVKDFHKRVIAPYGTNMTFVEILPGELIYVGNILSIREMSEEEVEKLNAPEVEEIVGLNETEVEVENLETVEEEAIEQPEASP